MNESAKNDTVHFEPTDVDARVIVRFVVGLAVALAAVMIAIWYALALLLKTEAADKRSQNPLAEQFRASRPNIADRLPPSPQLEGMAVDGPEGHTIGRMYASTAKLQAERDEAALNAYGKLADGTVRIPIAEALRRLAKAGSTPVGEYEQMPSGSNSGRAPNGGVP